MPTCDYCWTPYQTATCETCEKEHQKAIRRMAVASVGHKKGRPTLDVQEGNRHEYFSDNNRWETK